MPAAATGDPPSHLFRINVDPNYRTFPTSAEFLRNTKKIANTAPDGTFTNAVWSDLDIACGQCHGGGVNGSGAKVASLPLSKKQLARYAKGMHGNTNTGPIAAMTGAPTVTGHTVSFTDNSKDAQDPQYYLRIAVSWGDGKMETGQPGGTFLHTYRSAGTFTIRHTATDTEGLTGYESVKVVVP
jgi:PKD repeat protein